MQATYDQFQNMWWDSCENALVVAQDAHHQVLAAATMLEGHNERLSHSVTVGGPAAMGDWAVTGICIVKEAQGTIGGAHQLANKNGSPQQWATLGIP